MTDLFVRGVVEFNRQFFFEAHDLWEELWVETTGEHRLFYQGLIQTAVGCYHLSNGNCKGACSQFGKALGKLDNYPAVYHGVNVQNLRDAIAVCLSEAENLRAGTAKRFDETKIPRIEFE